MPGKGGCLGSQVPDVSPNHAPGAGKALQLLSSCDPWLEGKGRSTCLGSCCSCSPASASLVLGCSQRCQNTQTQHLQGVPTLSPASAGPTTIRHEVSVRAHPHLGTSGHSTKSFQPAGPSPAAPPCATAAQLKREMPASSKVSGKTE